MFAAFSTHEHGGTRTPAPQDRNLMLYPLNHVPSFESFIITYFAEIKPPILLVQPKTGTIPKRQKGRQS
jgi:hypothetical protein